MKPEGKEQPPLLPWQVVILPHSLFLGLVLLALPRISAPEFEGIYNQPLRGSAPLNAQHRSPCGL